MLACLSLAGFQSGSKRTSRLPPMRVTLSRSLSIHKYTHTKISVHRYIYKYRHGILADLMLAEFQSESKRTSRLPPMRVALSRSLSLSLSIHISVLEHIYGCIYGLLTCLSLAGFQLVSKRTSRFPPMRLTLSLSIHISVLEHIYGCIYGLLTCLSLAGFQSGSKRTSRLPPIRLTLSRSLSIHKYTHTQISLHRYIYKYRHGILADLMLAEFQSESKRTSRLPPIRLTLSLSLYTQIYTEIYLWIYT